jgi:hypothetical protein
MLGLVLSLAGPDPSLALRLYPHHAHRDLAAAQGFHRVSLKFSKVSLYIQFRHHTEHAVLQYQAINGHYWFHSPVPVSFLQAAGIPRIELHLFL